MKQHKKQVDTVESKKQDFYVTARNIWGTVVDKNGSTDIETLQQQLLIHRQLLNIFQAGNYYYLFFNIYEGTIEFVSPEVEQVLGYEAGEVNALFLMDKLHPDDRPYFLNFEHKITKFFLDLPFDKISKYKVQYDFRIKDSNNRYVRLLHQAVQIDYDQENFYRTLCVHTDISHIKEAGTPCLSIIGLEGEPSFYNIKEEHFVKSFDLFTKRERMILKCIVEGKSSKEIAAELYISLHTVNTHRKNMLAKAGVKSALDLVGKVVHEGWI
ncbi:MAG TPA: LuxR C-terminal-related transcriptional regulator [Chitinophagaceae bacterium]|nr:LuxR C-terminal-related transcriptional regulator [Chitinophagaceae bacterium]